MAQLTKQTKTSITVRYRFRLWVWNFLSYNSSSYFEYRCIAAILTFRGKSEQKKYFMPLWPTLRLLSNSKAYHFYLILEHVLLSLSQTLVTVEHKRKRPLCFVSLIFYSELKCLRGPLHCTALFPYSHTKKSFYTFVCQEKSLHFYFINGVFLSP